MKINANNVFLVDGIGAIVSSLFLGVVLPLFNEWIGLPLSSLYFLSICAVFLAIYSLSCFYFSKHTSPIWLQTLFIANALYCAMTAAFIAWHWSEIKILGILYFASETLIVLGVVYTERKIWKDISGENRA